MGQPVFLKAQNDFDDPQSRWQHLLVMIQNVDDGFERILDGVHENYLGVGYHDPTFDVVCVQVLTINRATLSTRNCCLRYEFDLVFPFRIVFVGRRWIVRNGSVLSICWPVPNHNIR